MSKHQGTYLYPRQLYCYCSVIDALQEKVCLPDFIEKCERWRNRVVNSGVYEDVYDRRMWTEFLNPAGIPFFYPTISRFALMLIGFNLSNIPSIHVVLYILLFEPSTI